MTDLEKIYSDLVNTTSDINEHLPTLKRYAEECDHVTEMGVRWLVSTFALLSGHPKTLISIDIQHPSYFGADISIVETIAYDLGCEFKFILGNTLEISIDETDLLFIDTWHAYKQLKSELDKHSDKVRKYIILHDTTSYEFKDETSYEFKGWVGTGQGIWPAIEEFLELHTSWSIHERYINNNGLTILKRN